MKAAAQKLLKPVIKILTQQISKALCMSINGFFGNNSGELLKMVSKRIEHIEAQGDVMKSVIKDSKVKMGGAIDTLLDSPEFQSEFARQMTEKIKRFDPTIACVADGGDAEMIVEDRAYQPGEIIVKPGQGQQSQPGQQGQQSQQSQPDQQSQQSQPDQQSQPVSNTTHTNTQTVFSRLLGGGSTGGSSKRKTFRNGSNKKKKQTKKKKAKKSK